ncbi:hypothetical protein ACLHIM_03525 [Ligilactobacillus sp. LYQ112]|uniref:hypothetical protein n=1 Tax=Ligilactobacillus sp. LYQ112 TaxID=3391060 RepID=UPI003982DE16
MKRGNFDKPRILRYGFLKAHEEHHDDKGHKTLICYDNQEHCFVRLKHDFVSNHGISYAMGVAALAPFVNSFTDWLSNYYTTLHWWLLFIVFIASLIGCEANRRNDSTQFEKIEQTDEVVNANVSYWLIYILGFIPIDLVLSATVHWSQYPYMQLGDILTIMVLVYINTVCLCILLEGLYVRIRYVR